MAFSDYKNIAQIQQEFNIKYHEENFFETQKVQPPTIFLQEFQFTRENIDVFTSEASRTEAVIFPVLREVYKDYHDKFALWIQKAVAYNEKLNGTPHYLIATKSPLNRNTED